MCLAVYLPDREELLTLAVLLRIHFFNLSEANSCLLSPIRKT
jgi:hypothetical protein